MRSDAEIGQKGAFFKGLRLGNPLVLILAIGLILRLGLLVFFWDQPLTIVDETHYQKIAENILNHHEFSYRAGQPTAFRPPLYPLFLSAVYFVTGGIHFNAIRLIQIILSLGIIWVVYLLGKTLFNEKCGLLAAFISAVYPSFVFFTHFLLTEVLFTFLFLLFVYYFISFLCSRQPHPEVEGGKNELETRDKGILPGAGLLNFKKRDRDLLLAGVFLGLSALTRSILYPFLAVTIIFMVLLCRGNLISKIKWAFLLAVGFILMVGPWTIRNYTLYKSWVVIDTMGGLNMYLGNYQHTPLNRAWAAIDLTGEQTWFFGHEKELAPMNEAQKQKWAMNMAKAFILDHKWLTLKRDLVKTANFWGLEREVIGPIINGHWPRLNKPLYLMVITLFIFSVYGLVAAGSVFGLLFHLQFRNKAVLFLVLLILFFTGMHGIVFGHSRYHLPLMPLLAICAAWTLMNIKRVWENRYSWRQWTAGLIVAVLIGLWAREILFVEGARFLANLF